MTTNEEKPEEPTCTQPEHGWFELGVEDSGETVSRCGSCKMKRYVAEDGTVRYETADGCSPTE